MKFTFETDDIEVAKLIAQTLAGDGAKAAVKGKKVTPEEPAATSAPASEAETPKAAPAPRAPGEFTPAVTAEAVELGIPKEEWPNIEGTGKGGNVTKTNVRAYAEKLRKVAANEPEDGDMQVAIKKLREMVAARGRDVAVKVMADFGVSRVTDLGADKLGEFTAKADEMIGLAE